MSETVVRFVIAVAALSVPLVLAERTPAQMRRCAKARPAEPLLGDAIRIGTATDERSVTERKTYHIEQVTRASIAIVTDESVCKQAANAYAGILRKSVDSTTPDKPVLVIRVRKLALVDDLRSRQGPSAYWEAMVFDEKWHRIWGYGAGA